MSTIYDNRSSEFKGKNLAPTADPNVTEEPVVVVPQESFSVTEGKESIQKPFKEMVATEHPTDIGGYEVNANRALT